jgi:hypothetical protein
MSATFWRRMCVALAVLCAYLAWPRSAATADDGAKPGSRAASDAARTASWSDRAGDRDDGRAGDPAHTASAGTGATAAGESGGAGTGGGMNIYGFGIPPWAAWFAPQRGEDMLSYRDRVVPVARAALAPQRERVTHARDELAKAAHLDATQLATLDAATAQTADAIEERVLGAVMNGDFAPDTARPMAGVQLARELLDDVAQGDQRFRSSLRDDQRATLAQQQFDFADYLLFTTKWEQALGYAD